MNQPSPSQESKAAKRGKMQVTSKLWVTDAASLTRAHDTTNGNQFLIRKIKASLIGQGETLQKGINRIQAIGQREFPGVVPIERIAAAAGDLGIVLSIDVGTRTLSEIIEAKQSEPKILESLAGLAEQLDVLHGQGIIHGDIRPETILLKETGEAQVLDFATGHVVHHWTAESRVVPEECGGHIVPSRHQAPEVRQGKSATAASDQYALAFACLEALALGRSSATETSVRTGGDDGSSELLQRLEKTRYKHLKGTLKRALSPEPEFRFPNCTALFQELSEKHAPKGAARKIPVPTGILLCLPLVLILGGKWVYTQYASLGQSRQAENRRRQALDDALVPYRVPIAKPPEHLRDGRLPQDSDLLSGSVFDKWKNAHATRVVDQATRQMDDGFSRLVGQLRTSLNRTVAMTPIANPPYAFAFSDIQGHLASGANDSGVELFFFGFPTPATELGTVPLRFIVDSQDGNPRRQEVTLGPGGASSSRITIAPRLGKWSEKDKLTVGIEVRHPRTSEWISIDSPIAADVRFGTVAWTSHPPVLVNPHRAANTGNAVASGVVVTPGMRYRITVDDKNKLIAPWEYSTFKTLGIQDGKRYLFEKELIGIPPEGVTVTSNGIGGRSYHAANPFTGNRHWGSLMMKTGPQGSWLLPTLMQMPITATLSGELLFGLNLPVRLQTVSGNQNLFGDKRYWGTQHEGKFEVRIETQNVTYPEGTPQSTQTRILPNLR